jgi:hypothetical protein
MPSYSFGLGARMALQIWRASVDQDGHYAFAVAL